MDDRGTSRAHARAIAPLSEGRTADHSIYTDPAVFEAEMRAVFARAWIYLGHECQVPEPGDHFLGHMGRTSVIVVRGGDGKINVLENRCAHRGPAVCTEPVGKGARAFICPYHGWSYRLDGALRSVPLPQDYGASFSKGERGLRRANVALYRGFIFASFDEHAPDIKTFLGDAAIAFDNFIDRSPTGKIRLQSAPLRHHIRANWKIVLENLNDVIHPLFAHASVASAGRTLAENTNTAAQVLAQDPGQLLAAFKAVSSLTTDFGHSFQPGLAATIRAGEKSYAAHLESLSNALGPQDAKRILDTDIYVAVIYPSVFVKPGSQNIRVIRPIAADETEVSTYYYRLVGAPDAVLEEAYEYHYSLGSPASPILSDDLHIYELIQSDYARTYRVSMERGADEMQRDPKLSSGTSEAYIRGQHRVWRRYLSELDA